MASFSVVAGVRESLGILVRFVAYYRRLGAESIRLFYDGSAEEFERAGLAALRASDVEVTVCDEAFWIGSFGRRPAPNSARQRLLFPMAQAETTADWLLICDADEFLIDRVPVAEFLAAVPAEVDSIVLPPAEAVWGPGEDIRAAFGSSWFRRPRIRHPLLSLASALRLYGTPGLYLRHGILGHTLGKQFVRRGARFDAIGPHNARRDDRVVSVSARSLPGPAATVEMAHFDAICLARWEEKFRLIAAQPLTGRSRPRRRQIRSFLAADLAGSEARARLFQQIYTIDARQCRWLADRNLAFQADLFGTPGP